VALAGTVDRVTAPPERTADRRSDRGFRGNVEGLRAVAVGLVLLTEVPPSSTPPEVSKRTASVPPYSPTIGWTAS
jgi:peptidoglycan/LPS O-acetylase OafA/YrhL